MVDKVDMSLDSIIKMDKKKKINKSGRPQRTTTTKRKINTKQTIRKSGPRQTSHSRIPQRTNETTMIHVSNLHFNVTDQDVRELFTELGPVRKAAVHYDKSGRSLGTAEIVFTTRDAAINAIRAYQGVPLDGRPLKLSLVPNTNSAARSPTKSRIGVKPRSGIFKKGQTKSPRGAPRGSTGARSGKPGAKPRGSRPQKKPVSAEQLDADLDAYKQTRMEI